ncbi:MAG: TetR/AcrR family transcriptional regulator [Anaerolineae bacterium]|nr:MAG: TetR/AcrR family transcriptional regulator [Anaerolineae bacterium]
MPTETFFNLPEEKRQKVFDAAVAEFAAWPFSQASVNRIVERAGISKGSFYQYFSGKEDLFVYLSQVIGEQKKLVLNTTVQEVGSDDLFSTLRALYLGGLRFAAQHPDYAAIGRNMLKEKDSPVYQRLLAEGRETMLGWFQSMLDEAVAAGRVRPDVNTHFTAYLIAALSAHVSEYYDEFVGEVFNERMLDMVDALIDLLRHGLEA